MASESKSLAQELPVCERTKRAPIVYGEVRRNLTQSIAHRTGLLTLPITQHPLIDYYRQLNSEISGFVRNQTDGANAVMVTSAMPGEGKSTIACNLAFSYTLKDKITPILIDLNGDENGLNHIFSLADAPGIMDYLVDPSVPLEQLIVNGPLENLKILPFGQFNERRFELLTSQRMEQVLCALEGLYSNSILIIDGPNMQKCIEVKELLSMLKGYILVVREGFSLQSKVRNYVTKLGTKRGAGVVFNQESYHCLKIT